MRGRRLLSGVCIFKLTPYPDSHGSRARLEAGCYSPKLSAFLGAKDSHGNRARAALITAPSRRRGSRAAPIPRSIPRARDSSGRPPRCSRGLALRGARGRRGARDSFDVVLSPQP